MLTEDIITVLIVDDHALLRETLARSLDQEARFQVIGTVGGAQDAIDIILKEKPRVVLMDIDMPGLIAFDAARRLAPLKLESKLIFLSAFLHDRYIEQAIAVGAHGYILKEEPLAVVIKALAKVAAGGVHFSERVWDRIMVTPKGLKFAGDKNSRLSKLSVRELEILRYIARGMTKKEIAGTVSLSEKTVETHTARLMNKLDIHDRVALAMFASKEGLVND